MKKTKKRSKKFSERLSLIWGYFILTYGVVVFLIGFFIILMNAGTQPTQTNIYSDEIKEKGLLDFFSGGDPMINMVVIVSLLLITVGILIILANKRAEKVIQERSNTIRF